jgi:Beta-mannanase
MLRRHAISRCSNNAVANRSYLRATGLAITLLMVPLLAFALRWDKAIAGIIWGLEPPSSVIRLLPKPASHVKLGIYNGSGGCSDCDAFGVEMFFADWAGYDHEHLKAEMSRAVAANRWPMITVEPWPHQRTVAQSDSLFSDIVTGKYDHEIASLCEDLNAINSPLFIRWGHEMENVNGRYPWSQSDVVGYVKAYRYFVDHCRALLSHQCFFVWSPVGRKELFRYWPGPDYVDQIGVSVYGFPEYDIRNFGKVRSFADIFSETYQRVSLFDKPIIIAELGVTGDDRHQRYWMYRAFRSFDQYPRLQVAVYYNSKDSPLAWGKDYPVPDWTILRSVFK